MAVKIKPGVLTFCAKEDIVSSTMDCGIVPGIAVLCLRRFIEDGSIWSCRNSLPIGLLQQLLFGQLAHGTSSFRRR